MNDIGSVDSSSFSASWLDPEEEYKAKLNDLKNKYDQNSQEILNNPNLRNDEKKIKLSELFGDTEMEISHLSVTPTHGSCIDELVNTVKYLQKEYADQMQSLSAKPQAPTTKMFGL